MEDQFEVLGGAFALRRGRFGRHFWFGYPVSLTLPAASGGSEKLSFRDVAKVVAIAPDRLAATAAKLGAPAPGAAPDGHAIGIVLKDGRKALLRGAAATMQRIAAAVADSASGKEPVKNWLRFGALALGLALAAPLLATIVAVSASDLSVGLRIVCGFALIIGLAGFVWPHRLAPSRAAAGGICAVAILGVAVLTPAVSDDPAAPRAARAAPVERTTNLGDIRAKIPDHAGAAMTREAYGDTFRRLGRARFDTANALLPWAAQAAALSPDCPSVEVASLSGQHGGRDHLVFFVDCAAPGQLTPRRFYIDEAQAVHYRDALSPLSDDDPVAGIAAPAPLDTMFGRINEADIVTQCDMLLRQAAISRRSIDLEFGWRTGGPDYDGSFRVQRDFSARNAFNARIDSAYSCTYDLRTRRIRSFSVRELTGWRAIVG